MRAALCLASGSGWSWMSKVVLELSYRGMPAKNWGKRPRAVAVVLSHPPLLLRSVTRVV